MNQTTAPDHFTYTYLVGDMRLLSERLCLHWAAFFSFLHLITKFNWLHRGDRLRWLTREQELKWQQLMRLTGTQRVRHCCCSNNNFSKQHADSSRDTDRVLIALLAVLFTFLHTSKVSYAYSKWTVNTYTITGIYKNAYVICTHSQVMWLSKRYLKNPQFPLCYGQTSYVPLSSFSFTPGHRERRCCADRCSYCLREEGTLNDSARCVHLMGFNLLWWRPTQVLILLGLLLEKTNINAINMCSTFHLFRFFKYLGASTTRLLFEWRPEGRLYKGGLLSICVCTNDKQVTHTKLITQSVGFPISC